jgi:hypothetical protein
VLAGILGLFARSRFRKVKPPQRTIASAKQSAAVLQGVKPHPRAVRNPPLKAVGAGEATPMEHTPSRQM